MISDERLAPLLDLFPEAKQLEEGGVSYVFLPHLVVQVGEERIPLDALLCPQEHSGYRTRLFLAAPITSRQTINGQAANWNSHTILGRTWYSWSWQHVVASLPLPQMLLAHLSALR